MRLIDADRIVYSWHIDADGEEHDGVTLESIIDKIPTVDAIEVVRCKDCKYYKTLTARCVERGEKAFLIRGNDDFCSRGERGEQDE